MQRASINPASLQEKIDQIRSGGVKKIDLGINNVSKGVVKNKGGRYSIIEKEKKFEEVGVKRKKRNYVLYESKLGTEKEKNLQKLADAPKPKPKPRKKPKAVSVARTRVELKIITKKKRLEYLDNYQYKETKVIKNPRTASVVSHQRLGDIIGFVYEEQNYQRMTVNNPSKRGNQISQIKLNRRTITTSRSVPVLPMEYRKEIKENQSNINININNRSGTRMRKNKSIIITNSSSRPVNERESTSGYITNMKTVTRGRSSGRKE